MKVKFETRKIRKPADGVPEEDKNYTPKTGEIDAANLDDAILAIKKGTVDIDPPLAVRSISPTGPDSLLVRLVDGPTKKAKPKPRRRAPRGQRG